MNRIWLNVIPQNKCTDISQQEFQKLNKKFIRKYTLGKKPQKHPHVIFMMGSPGSGKTTVSKQILEKLPNKNQYVYSNADDIVPELPQFKKGINLQPVKGRTKKKLASTHIFSDCLTIASYINDNIEQIILKKRLNALFDYPGSVIDNLARFKAAKYDTTLVYVHNTNKNVLQRVEKRAFETGLFIDPDLILNAKKYLELNFPLYAQLVDKVIFCDNSGTKPKCRTYNNPSRIRESTWRKLINL